jgi:hypothetical protein
MAATPLHDGSVSFDRMDIDWDSGRVSYTYTLRNAADAVVETYIWGVVFPFPAASVRSDKLQPALRCLGIALISYVYLPFVTNRRIVIRAVRMSESQLAFFRFVFEGSWAEYFYLLDMDIRGYLELTCQPDEGAPYLSDQLATTDDQFDSFSRQSTNVDNRNVLVPMGCGKDSCLLFDMLQKMGAHPQWLYFAEYPGEFETSPKFNALVQVSQSKSGAFVVEQHGTETCLQLSKRTTVPQIHFEDYVNYQTIVIFASVVMAVASDCAYISMGHEYSANEPHCWHSQFGYAVNHQFEKSFSYEKAMHEFLLSEKIAPVYYFSGLQHMLEIEIMDAFVAGCPQYLPHFMSCNCARDGGWCCACEKCAFVFVLLAASADIQTAVTTMHGRNLFAEPQLWTAWRQLMGVEGHRPLECVGSAEEVLVSMVSVREKEPQQVAGLKLFEQHADVLDTARREAVSSIARWKSNVQPTVETLYPTWFQPIRS